MSIRTKLLGLTTAVALVAGASLAAAAPATADGHVGAAKVKGSTTVTLDATVMGLLTSLGASIGAGEGAKAKGSKLIFPVTGAGDGYISHKGQLQITTSTGGAVGNNPMVEWATSPDAPAIATMVVDVPGIGETSLFTLSEMKVGNPKVKVDKKKKTRTSTQIIKAKLSVDAAQAGLLNLLLGTDLIADGQVLGKTMTKVVTTSKCQNAKCTK